MSSCSACLVVRAHWPWLGLGGLLAATLAAWAAAAWIAGPPRPTGLGDVAAGSAPICTQDIHDGAYCPLPSHADSAH